VVAGTGYGTGRQDRRHRLSVGVPAGRAGNPKSVRRYPGFLAGLIVRSFGLFAPENFTSVVILTLSALAVAGAVGMFLELEKGFGHLVHISPQPMHQAVKVLQIELNSVEP
jgi:hypothetical protein